MHEAHRRFELFRTTAIGMGWPVRAIKSLDLERVHRVPHAYANAIDIAWSKLRARDGAEVAIVGGPGTGRTWIACALSALLVVEKAVLSESPGLLRYCATPWDAVRYDDAWHRGVFARTSIEPVADAGFRIRQVARLLVVSSIDEVVDLDAGGRERWDTLRQARATKGARTIYVGDVAAATIEKTMPELAVVDTSNPHESW